MHEGKLTRLFERYRSKNDLGALAEVFDAVSAELLRVARHVAGRGIDPEDLVQSTFLAAIERADTFDVERPLVPWLMGILINQSRLARRRASPNLSDESARDLADTAMIEGGAEEREVDEAVTRVLSQLPETYREVLVPHLAEGKKPHEIARQLGRPQGTVRAQIHRGIRLMRKALPAGFAVGAFGILRSNGLAQVRDVVLEEAARASGQGPAAVMSVHAARAARLVRRRLTAVGTAVVLGGALWLAWPANGSARSIDTPLETAQADARGLDGNDLDAVSTGARTRTTGTRAADPVASAIEPEPYGSVRVRVLDATGKKPVAGARVTLLTWGDPHWYETPRVELSDTEGVAKFAHVHAGRVGARLDGGKQARGQVVADKETYIEATRQPGIEVDVTVRDGHGRGVPGARVDVFEEREGKAVMVGAPADESGHVKLADVAEGSWISARADSFSASDLVWLGLPQYAAANRAAVELDVRGGALALDGMVLDETGAFVAGASVVLGTPQTNEPLWRADGSAAFEPPAVHVATDAFGRFHADGLRATSYLLRVEAPGSAVLDERIDPVNGAFEPLTLHVQRGASVTGKVRFDDGTLASSVQFECKPRGDGSAIVAVSDSFGAFRIEGLEPGSVALQARAGGVGPVTRVELVVSSEHPTTWNPTVAHQETIQGHAIGEDGRLVKTWLVFAVPESTTDDDPAGALARWSRRYVPGDPDAMLLQCYLDMHGQFVVPCRSGATHRIELRPRASWQGAVQAVVSGVRAGEHNVELRVNPHVGGFQGRFVDARGKPMAMTIVVAVPRDVTAETRVPVDASTGRFEIQLMPGRYDLLAWAPRGVPWQVGRFEVPTTSRVDLGDLVVADPGEIAVETEGFRAAAVELASDRGLRIEMRAESAKTWVARELQPGKYHVKVTRPGDEAVTRDVEVLAGATARALISAE
jgi:RNA polymerase sigma-70 factor (ECF subfamily)